VRISSSVTSISWIPSEAITGHMKLPMTLRIGHYDDPPPDRIDGAPTLHALRADNRFRFANHLAAWIEVEDGRVVDAGYSGGGIVGDTIATLGVTTLTFPPVTFPDLQREPEVHDGAVRFVQSVGGATGAGMPRRIEQPPYVRIAAPTVWTTLALTLHADGQVEHELAGASPFPRHWLYDGDGVLRSKSGTLDFAALAAQSDHQRSPWGDRDAPAVVTDVESALERELSLRIMRGGHRPAIRSFPAGTVVTEQGTPGRSLYLLLDGVLVVEVDGVGVAEVGPGAIVGERAVLEGGRRTSTLRAVTPIKLAVAAAGDIDAAALRELATGHRREDAVTDVGGTGGVDGPAVRASPSSSPEGEADG
jgi:hypothetical protein